MSDLNRKNIVVFGISDDSVVVHQQFARSENLNFGLLSDSSKSLAKAYGALNPDGSIKRRTVAIDQSGTIVNIDDLVTASFVVRNGQLFSEHGKELESLFDDWKIGPGLACPRIALRNHLGEPVSLFDPSKRATVLFILSPDCPTSLRYEPLLASFARSSAYAQVRFATLSATGQPFKEWLHDSPLNLIRRAQITHTPGVVVFDAKRSVSYMGPLDLEGNSKLSGILLREALEAVLANRPAPLDSAKQWGSPISN